MPGAYASPSTCAIVCHPHARSTHGHPSARSHDERSSLASMPASPPLHLCCPYPRVHSSPRIAHFSANRHRSIRLAQRPVQVSAEPWTWTRVRTRTSKEGKRASTSKRKTRQCTGLAPQIVAISAPIVKPYSSALSPLTFDPAGTVLATHSFALRSRTGTLQGTLHLRFRYPSIDYQPVTSRDCTTSGTLYSLRTTGSLRPLSYDLSSPNPRTPTQRLII